MADDAFVPRFAAVPGTQFVALAGQDLPKSSDADFKLVTSELSGSGQPEPLEKSPAWRVAFQTNWRELPPAVVALLVEAALEIPGLPGDYYFLMLQATEALWMHRDENPWFRWYLERLCTTQIQLLRAGPSDLQMGRDYNSTVAFPRLARLLEEEGRLEEAAVVAEEGTRFGETDTRGKRLLKKSARVARDPDPACQAP